MATKRKPEETTPAPAQPAAKETSANPITTFTQMYESAAQRVERLRESLNEPGISDKLREQIESLIESNERTGRKVLQQSDLKLRSQERRSGTRTRRTPRA